MSLIDARITELKTALALLTTPRPLSEYHEDIGPVLWWKFPITEAPWVGTPNDLGKEVMVETNCYTTINGSTKTIKHHVGYPVQNIFVGGWPGYHTHWTPLPTVVAP